MINHRSARTLLRGYLRKKGGRTGFQSSEERRPDVTVSNIATHTNASRVELGVALPACLSRQRHARQTHAGRGEGATLSF